MLVYNFQECQRNGLSEEATPELKENTGRGQRMSREGRRRNNKQKVWRRKQARPAQGTETSGAGEEYLWEDGRGQKGRRLIQVTT